MGGIGMIAINAIVAAIFREFKLANPYNQEATAIIPPETTEENTKISPKPGKKSPPKKSKSPSKKSKDDYKEPKSKKVPPIKIRLPTSRKASKKKGGGDSDAEFEERLLEMEREQDDIDAK